MGNRIVYRKAETKAQAERDEREDIKGTDYVHITRAAVNNVNRHSISSS